VLDNVSHHVRSGQQAAADTDAEEQGWE
jgi:hypothetical protein